MMFSRNHASFVLHFVDVLFENLLNVLNARPHVLMLLLPHISFMDFCFLEVYIVQASFQDL